MSFSLEDMFSKRYTGGSYVHTSHYFSVGFMFVPPTHDWKAYPNVSDLHVLGFHNDLILTLLHGSVGCFKMRFQIAKKKKKKNPAKNHPTKNPNDSQQFL